MSKKTNKYKKSKLTPRKVLYKINKESKCGEVIECPVCHTKFTKKQYSQAFCCSRCKDKYWNDKGDRHGYTENCDDESLMTDMDWDEMFGVAEYNDSY